MDRRSLLIGLMALAVPQVACQQSAANALQIAAIKDILPPQVLSDLKQTLAATPLRLRTQRTAADLFQQLQVWHGAIAPTESEAGAASARADWVCLSDYWLWGAIQQQLISPLTGLDALPGWAALPKRWGPPLRRDAQGFWAAEPTTWATPYRWGQLMMVYSQRQFDRLGWQPTTWQDLLRPELQGRIALPDHPRLVLGLLLKALGYSANDRTPAAHADLTEAIAALRPQVKLYASDNYLQPLIMEDIALAVGWSTEVRPVLSRYRQLQAVTPDPGTLLTADVWVKPNPTRTAPPAVAVTPVDQQWLSYWWQPEVVAPLSLFSQGLSPALLSPARLRQPLGFDSATVYLPTAAQVANSEFIEPLPETAIAAYRDLWLTLRRGE